MKEIATDKLRACLLPIN